MKFVREDVKEEGIDLGSGIGRFLNGETEKGFVDFLSEIIDRERKADMWDTSVNRFIVFTDDERNELAQYAKRFLGEKYRPFIFLDLLLKPIKDSSAAPFNVTYVHVDNGDRDPTFLVIHF